MMRSWLAIVAVLVLGATAFAQLEPAGNQHPAASIPVDDHAHGAPFGTPSLLDQTPEQKAAFAAAIDLSPLRATAVFHNGRVKILDTLAREVLRTITGRERYDELVLAGGASLANEADRYASADPERFDKTRFDALFVLLDLSIDPAHYADRPLIAIDYLPVREYYLEAAFPDDAARQDLWLRMTRVSPIMVETLSQPIFDRHGHLEPVRASIGRADNALRVAAGAGAMLRVVAPESNDQQWTHLEDLPADHPARAAAVELGRSWRALDADAANAAIVNLAAQLAAINPDTHPAGRARVELFYNDGRFFDLGMWVYGLSFLALILAFGTGRKWLIGLGVGLLAGALMLHASGFVLRCVVSERFAIQNQFESMVGLSLFAATVATGLMLLKRQWLFGAAAAGVGFLVLIAATQTAIPGQAIGREAAILNTSVLLKYHVTTVLVSYGLITVGFLCSVFYLLVALMSKRQGAREAASVALHGDAESGKERTLARTLDDLDKAQMTVLQLAFWTLGVGILLGAWWADHSWGRWWAWDPKETWALITWIVYLIVIHVRLITGQGKALLTAWLSVAGFGIMLWTYFGVNLLLAGLHAYA